MAQKEIIDRDTYKKIKKMDRETLTKFILQYGDELLGDQGKTIDLPALEVELSKIKAPPKTSEFLLYSVGLK